MEEQSAINLAAQTAPIAGRKRGRRRHPAMVGRIVATGVGSTAFFGSLAGIAANPPTWTNNTSAGTTEAAAAPGEVAARAMASPTTVVIERVARTFYVDQAGNPVAAPTSTTPTTSAAVPADQVNQVPRATTAAPVAASDGASAQALSSTPRASAASAAPAPTTAAAPAATPAAPPVTTPPATSPPTTAAPKPTTPPTTVPACQTSKC
ncbi:MAG: hypothetical protein F2754_11530 [Actinobacteria bacterium]|uniref:Unannotated protein n=1 Tax=freshwater metagenome TaxID=449393 RepID=A0A6J7J697_9ZZZZ|nr:hypothetical protein [Actinomycetota bacterium]MSX88004.1 hypothetical protein [Actinomycetota bacterium]MSY71455.1 hypothetical protein [Actinomycetota bacterium]